MVNVVIEFDSQTKQKLCRFTIKNRPDDYVWLNKGDEIGFDLVESKEFFYVEVIRKVYLDGKKNPIYIICLPCYFPSLDEVTEALEKFKLQFGDDVSIDPNTIVA
jgi:hypothetical protein